MVNENHDSSEMPSVDEDRTLEKPVPRKTGPFGTDPSEDGAEASLGEAAEADGAETPDEVSLFQETLHARIVESIKTVYDPEIPVDVYELGLIYEIEIDEEGNASIQMTLTSPACPVAGSLPGEVEEKVAQSEGVKSGKVELVWDPPWTPELMSESAKLELGMM